MISKFTKRLLRSPKIDTFIAEGLWFGVLIIFRNLRNSSKPEVNERN